MYKYKKYLNYKMIIYILVIYMYLLLKFIKRNETLLNIKKIKMKKFTKKV